MQSEDARFAELSAGLAHSGWYTCPEFADPRLITELAAEARTLSEQDAFRPAGVGRGADWQVDVDRRGDLLHWLDPGKPTAPQQELWQLLERLRLHLNRELFLALWELELHYAVYPPGRRYERHVDQFESARARKITVLLYLNQDWSDADGGGLLIYPAAEATAPAAEVLPRLNTLVCFRSDLIPHEVLAPRRLRYSLGGWYRLRPEVPLAGAAPRSM